MGIEKISLEIPRQLYDKIEKNAELKGYQAVEDLILDLIRFEVFVSKEDVTCKEEKTNNEEFKVLNQENSGDNNKIDDSPEFSYFGPNVERELDDRGFNEKNS